MDTEKKILKLSFFSGLLFAIIEFIFAIYSRSQSALTDAVYDASELIFIALLLFITPLFYKPINEKHPYGYYQIESIFVVIKCVMMLSVSFGIAADILESILSGGNHVNSMQIAIFQCCLGLLSIVIYGIMKHMNHHLSSPSIEAELLGWRLDIYYSLGMTVAFFLSYLIKDTSLHFLYPYFDQIIAVLIMIFMLPENCKILWKSLKEIFLFSPESEYIDQIKTVCTPILDEYHFHPTFFDITQTGRHLWIAIYFQIEDSSLEVEQLKNASIRMNHILQETFPDCTLELILNP